MIAAVRRLFLAVSAHFLSEIRDRPHLHRYREGYGLEWAEAIDWYDLNDPFGTLARFLELINGRFPHGIQMELY